MINLDASGLVSNVTLKAIESALNNNLQLWLKSQKIREIETEKEKAALVFENDLAGLKAVNSKAEETKQSLIFELGRLEQALEDRNKDYGSLLEKLSLTQKALAIAEERIEELILVEQARDDHFKELQEHCATHEKKLRQVSGPKKPSGSAAPFVDAK